MLANARPLRYLANLTSINHPLAIDTFERHLFFLRGPISTTCNTAGHQMLFLAALPVVSFFFPGFAIAVISAPDCRSTWEWSFNSLGQSACMVAAFMMSTCNAGSFTVDPLPQGHSYPGPGGTDDSNLCKCSTVGYSLLSACAGCQGEHWISWSEYVTNCTTTLPPSFPNPIPSGTLVPRASGLSSTSQKRTFGTPTNRLSSVIPSR